MMLNKIALVQCYIHHVKGVEVDIMPPQSIKEFQLLDKAYQVAREYFGMKHLKINL